MPQTIRFVVGSYQTNCFAVRGDSSSRCCLIDPGDQADRIMDTLEREKLTLDAILLTHGHFDHVGAVREIAARTGCKVYIHAADLTMPPMMTGGKLYYTHTYDEGDLLELGGLAIRVLHTPGHTPGCVCMTVGDLMFSGDTLFAGSCGRTDLPGGDWDTLAKSLKRLSAMDTNYRVFPGHGPATTLAAEKQSNPYMR